MLQRFERLISLKGVEIERGHEGTIHSQSPEPGKPLLLVKKIFSQDVRDLYSEFFLTRVANEAGIAPRPLYFDTKEMCFQIEMLLSPPLSMLKEEEQLKIVCESLPRTLRKLHERKFARYGRLFRRRKLGSEIDLVNHELGWLQGLAQRTIGKDELNFLPWTDIKKFDNQIRAYVKKSNINEVFTSSPTEFSLVHFDISINNIFVGKDSEGNTAVTLIDFGRAHFSDPALDIAMTFYKNSIFDPLRVTRFLKNYCPDQDEREKLERKVKFWLPLVALQRGLWFLNQYYKNRDPVFKESSLAAIAYFKKETENLE